MPRARLLPGSNFYSIQYDGSDPNKLLMRGGDWVTVDEDEATYLAQFHRSEVEVEDAPAEAQKHLDAHAASVMGRQMMNRVGGDLSVLPHTALDAASAPKAPDLKAIDG